MLIGSTVSTSGRVELAITSVVVVIGTVVVIVVLEVGIEVVVVNGIVVEGTKVIGGLLIELKRAVVVSS